MRHTLLKRLESYIRDYVTFADDSYVLPAALWVLGTYCWPGFDAFPYLVITSDTKRSGKTRLSEVLSFAASNPRNFAGMTPASLFRSIREENPTVFIDEAETLSSEAANTMRAVLNVGYRKGQSIPRFSRGGGVEEWPVYCPKVFILIGDVYDTLRDRSIIVRMQRAEPLKRFRFEQAKAEGNAIGADIVAELESGLYARVKIRYDQHPGLDFLSDRDAEIWLSLFALAEVVAPHRIEELQRDAADMATEKTATARRYVNLLGAEKDAEDDEYARRLLDDMATILSGNGHRRSIWTAQAIERLHDMPTSPWRKFRGTGLGPMDLANLLARFGIRPRLIRWGKKVARGYTCGDVTKAQEGGC